MRLVYTVKIWDKTAKHTKKTITRTFKCPDFRDYSFYFIYLLIFFLHWNLVNVANAYVGCVVLSNYMRSSQGCAPPPPQHFLVTDGLEQNSNHRSRPLGSVF